MKKFLTTVLGLLCVVCMVARDRGINFRHDLKWDEAIELAKKENKLVFVDFYTQWCGPCFNMAQKVFTLPDVGAFYNSNFINMKIDCEEPGEGVALARKYNVKSYPTYGFVDPSTGELIHLSSSRQEPETFILTGENALNPERRSFVLNRKYEEGDRSPEFLGSLIEYKASIYKHEEVKKIFDELISTGAKLSDPEVWTIFDSYIKGISPYLQTVSDNYADYCSAVGKSAVDAKLARETQYGSPEAIAALCDFDGKEFNLKMIEVNNLVRDKEYDRAAALIDGLIADPQTDRQALIDRLKFIARLSYKADEMPDEWFGKCVGYLRFIAYNNENRDDAYVHQEYADALERMIARKFPDAGLLPTPAAGKTTYTMRPDALKAKPKRK
ncbi:MAG: thioredoxin family protein [Muribaculaceae bacterium]|nr:thioredoxin family protein [Muribaculaceae bacterium]